LISLGLGDGDVAHAGQGLPIDLGDVFVLTQQMNASGPFADWQAVLTAVQDKGVAGVEISGQDIHLTQDAN
jgi:hypothetical protein